MRILQLISSAGYYGAESMLIGLSRELARSGLEVVVGAMASPSGRHREVLAEAEQAGLAAHAFAGGGRLSPGLAAEISTFLEQGIDIVHAHNYKANFYALLAAAPTGARLVATCHNWIRSDWKVRAYARLDKLLLRHFDRVVAVSEAMERELRQAGLGGARLRRVPNGIDAARYAVAGNRSELGLAPAETVIGSVGRLSPEKGYLHLLEAFGLASHSQPGLRLLIVGDGPQRAELETRASQLGLTERVIFTGQRRDVAHLLAVMDIFVLPSFVEQLPMAVLEAMAAGKPVIATAVGGLPTLLGQGEAGLLVAPGDVAALARAVERLVTEPALREAICRRAHEVVSRHYSAARMAADYLAIYEDLLRAGPRRYGLPLTLAAGSLSLFGGSRLASASFGPLSSMKKN